jgi:predicted metal-binding membrane protein
MTAMMLPGAAASVFRRGRVQSMPLFVGSYLAVWTLVGLAVCRRRCQEQVRSGFEFGLVCVGSSIGLMLMVVALGVMSITWMSQIAALVLAQKLLTEHQAVDLPVALAIVALGIAVTADL